VVTAKREVTAKMKVFNVSESQYGTQVTLGPDYTDERNKEWAAASPAALIQLTIKNELASEVFSLQRPFLVTFTPEE
jgi:hypothetical protein